MKYIADLHIHSHYSMATSKDLVPEKLDLWARKKGISLVGTGDLTHEGWRKELREKLTEAGDGFYRLKEEYREAGAGKWADLSPEFVVTGEISSVYKKNGKTRKVHNVVVFPDLESADRLASRLEKIGNIHADGRPILKLDCRDLAEMVKDSCDRGMVIPAHIWTPHFSVFGQKSGFDSLEECFEDMTPYIHALETGLSSDPAMNRKWSALDDFQMVSNSDAHSPSKLGREATLLDGDFCYEGLRKAIETGEGLTGTIEFYPEEGKYFDDGHRKCGFCADPEEAVRLHNICPVCGKKMTMGVNHRIHELADRTKESGHRKDYFESLVPLPEIISEVVKVSPASKKVTVIYEKMLGEFGSEFDILRSVPVSEIAESASAEIAEGIHRLREGRVTRIPGYDGEFGKIKVLQ